MKASIILYISGAARSGTSWLAQLINSSSVVRFRFQPLFSYEFKSAVNEDSSIDELNFFFDALYDSKTDFLIQKDKTISGEYPAFKKKSNQYCLALKENKYQSVIEPVLRKVSNLKFIGIVRNPCAVLNSWSKNPKEFPPGSVLRDEWRFANCKNKGNEDYFGYYKWKEIANLYLDLQIKYPERAMLVKYEELAAEPLSITEKIFNFADLPFEDQTRNFIVKSTTTHNESYYSVFKSYKNPDNWKNELDPYIISEIYEDLKGTRLESFL